MNDAKVLLVCFRTESEGSQTISFWCLIIIAGMKYLGTSEKHSLVFVVCRNFNLFSQ